MPRSIFRVSQNAGTIATVSDMSGLEHFGEAALPGVYDIDVIHAEPIDGHTSWRWGELVKYVNGIVKVVGDETKP